MIRYKSVMPFDDTKKRLHVLFSGRVQGVGFRFTICRIAETLQVTGFVRNLWNGDVELVAEGPQESLTDFLHEIRNSRLRQHIEQDWVTWESFTGKFDRFGVAF